MKRLGLCMAASLVACGPTSTTVVTPPPAKAPPPAPSVTKPAPPEAPPPPPATTPWAKSGIDWTKPPPPDPPSTYVPPTATAYRLNNGIRVLTVRRKRLPLVSIRILSDAAGSVRDPRGRSGLAAITADMLDEGAGPWSATELAVRLETLGADLWVGADADTGQIALDTLTSTLDESLAVAAAVLTRPRFAEPDFDRIKSKRIGRIRRRADRARTAAQIVFDRVVFGGHPYGNPISGDEATVKRLRLDQARKFYRRHWQPKRITIIAVGDFDPKQLRGILDARFAKWKPRARRPAKIRARIRKTKRPRLYVVNRPGSTQTSIRYGRRTDMLRSDPRFYVSAVVNTALGGSYTSRLNNRLREQLGFTYGAGSRFWFGTGSGSWSVSTSIEAKNSIPGIREALALVESVRKAPLPADELARSKQLMARRLPQQFETNADVARSFARLVRHGQPLTWHRSYADRIRAVDAKGAHDYATKHWRADDLTLVVVGDLSKILDGLLGLGLGPALELDTNGNVLRTHRPK